MSKKNVSTSTMIRLGATLGILVLSGVVLLTVISSGTTAPVKGTPVTPTAGPTIVRVTTTTVRAVTTTTKSPVVAHKAPVAKAVVHAVTTTTVPRVAQVVTPVVPKVVTTTTVKKFVPPTHRHVTVKAGTYNGFTVNTLPANSPQGHGPQLVN